MKNISSILFVFVYTITCSYVAHAQWVKTSGPAGVAVYALAVVDTNLFAGTSGGVFLSTNNGTSWTQVNTGLPASTTVRSLVADKTRLFAGTSGKGAYLSTNDGATWNPINSGMPATTTIMSFAVLDTNLFACTGNGVFRSVNAGTNWIQTNLGLTSNDIRALFVADTNIFAAAMGGVFLSTNCAATWTQVNIGLTNTDVWSLTASASCVFAGTHSGGVFVTAKNGTSWTQLNSGLPPNAIVQSLTSVGRNIFAGTFGSGVFLSTNDGAKWTDISAGFTNLDARCLAASSTHLFAGTYNGGVWRRSLSEIITGVENKAGRTPSRYELHQNYPNPFNPATTISFSLPTKSFVSLKVFDVLGKQVSSLASEELSAGTHSKTWNAVGLSSGVYFYRLQAGTYSETKKLNLLE
jgi:photosystem II stability/assembly factor-like uncharacterized protein